MYIEIPLLGIIILAFNFGVSALVYKKFGEIYALIAFFVLLFATPLAIRYVTLGY